MMMRWDEQKMAKIKDAHSVLVLRQEPLGHM